MRRRGSGAFRISMLLAMVAISALLLPVAVARWSQTLEVGAGVGAGEGVLPSPISRNVDATVQLLPQTLQKKAVGVPVLAVVDLPAGYDVTAIETSTLRLCPGGQPCEKGSIPPVGRGWIVCHRDGDLPDLDDSQDSLPDWLGKDFPRLDASNLGSCRHRLILFFEREELYGTIKDRPTGSDLSFTLSGRSKGWSLTGRDGVKLVAVPTRAATIQFRIDMDSFRLENGENRVIAFLEASQEDLDRIDGGSMQLCLGTNLCSDKQGLRPLSWQKEGAAGGQPRWKLFFDRGAILALVKGVDPRYTATFTLSAVQASDGQKLAASAKVALAGIQQPSPTATPSASPVATGGTPTATSGTPAPGTPTATAGTPTPGTATPGTPGLPTVTATAGTPGAGTPTATMASTAGTAVPAATATPGTPSSTGTPGVQATAPAGSVTPTIVSSPPAGTATLTAVPTATPNAGGAVPSPTPPQPTPGAATATSTPSLPTGTPSPTPVPPTATATPQTPPPSTPTRTPTVVIGSMT